MTRQPSIGVALMLTFMCVSGARATDRIIGAHAPNGGAYLVKHFKVAPGVRVNGVRFVNNDPSTVFPSVILCAGSARRLSDATLLLEFTNVRPIEHRVAIDFTPLVFDTAQDVYVAVELPPGSGNVEVGSGPGIGAVQAAVPTDSYYASGRNGHLGTMDVEYDIELVAARAGKVREGKQGESTIPLVPTARVRPNPFNPTTIIEVGVPRKAHVRVAVFSVSGRLVKLLVDSPRFPGVHTVEWDGSDDAGRQLASGLYVARVSIDQTTISRKLVLTK